MKAFSVVFRDKATDKLYSGVVDHAELCRLSNLETIKICCVREMPLDKYPSLCYNKVTKRGQPLKERN